MQERLVESTRALLRAKEPYSEHMSPTKSKRRKQERLAESTRAFAQAHAAREAAEDARDGRRPDPAPDEIKREKVVKPWPYKKPPPAFTGGEIV